MAVFDKKEVRKPIVLMVLDGLGAADPNKGNAVTQAKTTNLNLLWPKYDHTYLQAAGNYVGLPNGVTGNSEVGHMSLGAGRIVYQEIAKIDKEIEDGKFYKNEVFLQAIANVKKTKGNMHIMGLVSDGQVHSSLEHLFACIEFCKKEGLDGKKVFIHAFTDGRDTAPQNAAEYLELLEARCKRLKTGRIASIVGRYYAMDRDDRWDRVKQAYGAIVFGRGIGVEDWREAIKNSYSKNVWDEYLEPYVVVDKDKPIGTVENGDSLIFFNYRGDRAVELSKPFEDETFYSFPIKKLENFFFAGFSNYEKGMIMNRAQADVDEAGSESEFVKKLFNEELKKTEIFPKNQIFPPVRVEDSLGKLIADSGLSQLRISESEKFPHVTYFFNCRQKDPFDREDRVELPSPKEVKTYDEKPEMSAREITEKLVKAIKSKKYDFILVNFANPDMVAHTGNIPASIKAVEVTDECVGVIVKAVQDEGGELIITADHGNSEEMINLATNEMDTKHSVNPVPIIYVSKDGGTVGRELQMGMLADIAPTVLSLMHIDVPHTMMGRNLVV